MNNQIKCWLAIACSLSTIVANESIEIHSVRALPSQQAQPQGIVDRLIFYFNGGAKTERPRASVNGKRRTRVAGSRNPSTCGTEIVALMPRSNLGITRSSQPTFWFYLGASNLPVKSIKLSIFKPDNSAAPELWTSQLPVTSKKIESGLLKISYQGQPLVDGDYQWQFSYQQVGCQEVQTLSGYVRKESQPNIPTFTNYRERLFFYANNGIWHELLTDTIALRQQRSGDLQLNEDFRSLFFESADVRYTLSTDETTVDRDLTEKIINARVIDLPASDRARILTQDRTIKK
jgi:hypothetical protein